MSESLVRLIYLSRAVRDEHGRPPDLGSILAASRRNNPRLGVTGVLMVSRGEFGQVLEGPEDGVEALYERIEHDPRHRDFEVFDLHPITERAFPDWSMGHVGRVPEGVEADPYWEDGVCFGAGVVDPAIASLYRRVFYGDQAIVAS